MKHPYLNTVYTNLILQRDYEPVQSVGPVMPQELLFLQKYHHDTYFLVQLIDGDIFDPQTVRTKLKADYQSLVNMNSNQLMHMVEVLVFDQTPSEEMISAMEDGLTNPEFAKCYFSCFIVDLSTRTVIRQSKSSINTDGLEKLLKTQFNEVNPDYEVLPDINGLLALRRQEYTIDVKVAKPALTYALIGINIAVFVFFNFYATMQGRQYESMLVDFGAKDNALIITGQYWRLISPIFLHGNWLHLLVNCYSLFVVGNIVERIFGHPKYAAIYFLAGIYGSIASFILSSNPAVGASGAIFGLLGALVYYGVERPKIFKKYFGYNVWITLLMNIVIGFSMPGIDNFAHLGGLGGGFLTAYALKVSNEKTKILERMILFIMVFFLAVLAFYYGLMNPNIPNPSV